jgi:hypothetical protein
MLRSIRAGVYKSYLDSGVRRIVLQTVLEDREWLLRERDWLSRAQAGVSSPPRRWRSYATADIYPPVGQRAVLPFADALQSVSTALRRDECGDWRKKEHAAGFTPSPARSTSPAGKAFSLS